MERISPEHKEILIMVCAHGMQYAEVSETLGIPVGTVRSRLSRARESLQNEMGRTSVRAYNMPPVPASHAISHLAA
ncbi:MAG: RNA polymerase sigma factor [Alphaproteobacteria bacterium]|nr:RNA polymerase sigma factor [Alphaproteobacteria bacterium]